MSCGRIHSYTGVCKSYNINPVTSLYVHYGCGLCAPERWMNFDASPTLRIQQIPIIGRLVRPHLNVVFPSNVRYGDIVKGLPVDENSCQGVFCSHVLEHLSLEDFRKALRNTYKMMKPEGLFRCVVPDLEYYARAYICMIDHGLEHASYAFLDNTFLGRRTRPRGIKGMLKVGYGNADHQWMWDKYALADELKIAGFVQVRECQFNDSTDEMFKSVEDIGRFTNAVAFECSKTFTRQTSDNRIL